MKSYDQSCALAKALDVIGDRWTLLIIRELLIRDLCRYSDLKDALPGIATNLLAARLRKLEEDGIVLREEAKPPVATTTYRLTERGYALERAILELGRWGAPLLSNRSRTEQLQAHWLVMPLRLHLRDRHPDRPPVAVEVRADDEAIAIEAAQGKVNVRLGTCAQPDATIKGKAAPVLRLLTGRLSLVSAETEGVKWEGSRAAISRFL